MKKIRTCARWMWRTVLLVVLLFNVRFYAASPLTRKTDKLPPSLVAQLNANRLAIDSGAPKKMQQFFPEGYYFCHVLHGLTWVEAALRDPSVVAKAITEAKQAYAAIDSIEGRMPFPPSLPPDHGMFYAAWKADLQAGIVLLTVGEDPESLERLRGECDQIAGSIRESSTPFLASYHNSAWPCDTFPAVHALATYDHVTGEGRYTSDVNDWLSDVRSNLDKSTGLVSHTASLPDVSRVSIARATSQVIMLRFMADIDPDFGREQYLGFREKFLTTFVGIPCVLEYPRGVTGEGDVDSGPLIFGRSISGTVLAMSITQIYGDADHADAIAQAGEVVGLPWTTGSRKSYVGGVLPVGDIIVAYSHVARPWFGGEEHRVPEPLTLSALWRWKVHALSLCLFVPTVIGLRRKKVVDLAKDPSCPKE